MRDITEIRKEIDAIDEEIVSLFCKRMALCEEVAQVKQASGDAVLQTNREQEVLSGVRARTPEKWARSAEVWYETLMTASKCREYTLLRTLPDCLRAPISAEDVFPKKATVACQGRPEAFGHRATESIFAESEIHFFRTFEEVFSAVEEGKCEYGVLPAWNSTAGSVTDVYRLMKKHRLFIVRSVRLKVAHCLAILPDAEEKDIRTVTSHPQALWQCSEYLKCKNWRKVESENTALAAEKIRNDGNKECAVLCSEACAKRYGLKVLQTEVQDEKENYTRFICIAKKPYLCEENHKLSVSVSLHNQTGSLNKLLCKCSVSGINLTKIESQPDGIADFLFYLDMDGKILDESVRALLADLEKYPKFIFLGSYREVL